MSTPSPDCRRLPVPLLVLGLVLIAAQLLSCRGKAPPAKHAGPAFKYEKTFSREGAEVELQLDRQSLNVAEYGRLVITATGPERWPAIVDPPAAQPQGITLAEIDRQGPTLVGTDRTRVRFVYQVRPFLPGAETINSFQIRFGRPDAEVKIETEPVKLTVLSLLSEQKKAILNDIAPPMAMPDYLLYYLAAGTALLLVLLFFVWWRFTKRAKRKDTPPPPSPHQRAHQALDHLVARGLLENGELSLFFRELSDILRRYIEERFRVQAPEQTTEEFLQTIAAMSSFRAADRELLQDFLSHCDLVKFARLEPTVKEGENRLQLCRRFIDESAIAVAPGGTGGQP